MERIMSGANDATPSSAPAIDPCPTCGEPVDEVVTSDRTRPRALPCGHGVSVTLWDDRVELARP